MTVTGQTVRQENRSVGKEEYCGGCGSDSDRAETREKPDRCVRMNVVIAGTVTLIVLRA